jgi:hypothetical protein
MMTETPQKININIKILPDTDVMLEEIARLTFRNKGAVIDWLISEKHAELIPSPTSESR